MSASLQNLDNSSGKEVLLCKPNEVLLDMIKEDFEQIDYCIIELYRFDDDCNKKLKFKDNKCVLFDGTTLELIFRASSNRRIEQFLAENKKKFKNLSIGLFPASEEIKYVGHQPCVQLYADKLLAKLNKENMNCVECGKAISENKAMIVEIDEVNFINDIGYIHRSCLRPTIRVLGWIESEFFKKYNVSNSFNWELWLKKIQKGQGLLNNSFFDTIDSIPQILWNSTLDYTQQYNYCIKIYLEDESINYILQRGKIHQFSKEEAENFLTQLNILLVQKKQEKDYLCITNKEKAIGTFNSLKNRIDFDDKLIKIEKYEVDKITKRIIDEYKIMDNYYAPLIYITLGENQDIFEMDNIVVLLSNPLEIQKYIQNWKNVNIHLEEMELVIIKNDKHFDNFMNIVFKKYEGAIINPQFNVDGELIKFIEIKKFEDVVNN